MKITGERHPKEVQLTLSCGVYADDLELLVEYMSELHQLLVKVRVANESPEL